MAIRGDFQGLESLRTTFRNIEQVKRALLQAAATEARTQVALEFRQSVDPEGQAWARLAYRKGMPLRDTGRLANSFTAKATENGFVLGTNVTYAKYHQYGARVRKAKGRKSRGTVGRLPMRRIVPEGTLSSSWKRSIEKAVDLAFRKFWRS